MKGVNLTKYFGIGVTGFILLGLFIKFWVDSPFSGLWALYCVAMNMCLIGAAFIYAGEGAWLEVDVI